MSGVEVDDMSTSRNTEISNPNQNGVNQVDDMDRTRDDLERSVSGGATNRTTRNTEISNPNQNTVIDIQNDSDCEKDFTKLSIKIDKTSMPSAVTMEMGLRSTDPTMKPEDAKNSAEKSYASMNAIVKNGIMDVCLKKCANKSVPMILFDKSKTYTFNDAMKNISDTNSIVCLGEPSSEKNDNKVKYKCAQGEYSTDIKKCIYTPPMYLYSATIIGNK
jgi:hypothetical protein